MAIQQHTERRQAASRGASIAPSLTRADWRHAYRNARLIRDAFGVAEKPRSPLAAALLDLHHQLPARLERASADAAIMGPMCARRLGDSLNITLSPITAARPSIRVTLRQTAGRLPA